MASLFEYNRQLDELFARATDEDGKIDESMMEELEALQMDRDEKLDNCIWFYKSRKAMAAALKDEKKIYVNGYLKGQIKEDDEYIEAYYPQQIIIDCTKLDLENEGIAKLIQFTMSVFKVKGKNLWNMGIKCNLKQGAEEIIFDESCLTDFQRMQIELGRKTLDDYKPRGNVYGKSITEIRFSDFLDKMEQFSEGSVETDVRTDDMVIATSKPKVQTVEDVKKEEKKDDESSALAGLFD